MDTNVRLRFRAVVHTAEKVLRVGAPVACSVLLVWWIFERVDFRDVMGVLRGGVKLWPVLTMMFFNGMSYVIRGTRWGLQLRGVGVKVPEDELVVSIFGAYALNLLLNGVGEAWRCLFISHRNNVSLSKVVGTDVGDRGSDAAVVIVVLGLTVAVAAPELGEFMTRYHVSRDFIDFFHNYWLWGSILTAVVMWLIVLRTLRHCRLVEEVDSVFTNVWEGFKVLFTMPHKWWYLWLTIGIWICYFMQTYICFLAFPFSEGMILDSANRGLQVGLVVMLFGSLSMAIPSSGGLGPWNIAVMFALSLYGINSVDAAAYALVVWAAQALLQCLLGLYALIWVTRHTRPKIK